MNILLTVLLFAVIIFIHELGHFITAKACGIKVNEFSLGMGPAIFKKTAGETTYAVRVLPFGGYVSMEGENDDSDDDRAFCNKKISKRFLVLVAGAVMNLLLGFLVTLGLTASSDNLATNTVAMFIENASTQASGLQVDDTILKVNGRNILVESDIVYELLRDDDGLVSMVVKRGGEKVELDAIQFAYETTETGNQLKIDFKVYGREKGFWSTISYAFKDALSTARLIWLSFSDLITGRASINDLSGPVGISQVVSEASSMGLATLLTLLAFITINVGIFNLLPIPALDGGRILFLLIEAVRGKPVKPEREGLVHLIGFILVIGLLIIVTVNDIRNLF